MTAALLSGVRVLDLSRLLPGPFATRLLSDMGAEVIKVEPPEGDGVRTMMPGLYEFLNRGKRAVRVDLKTEAGREFVLDLAATCDVVMEGFRPGVADRLGVGFDAVRARRADVVYCSLSGFGQDGPKRDHPGHDIDYEAAGGAFASVLAAGEPPAPPHVPVGDLSGATFSALTICAALAARARGTVDNRPVHLDVSIQETVAYFAASRWGPFLLTGEAPRVEQLANWAPGHGMFQTAGGEWLVLAAIEDKFWVNLCTALQRPDMAEPPYARHADRMVHRHRLRAELDRMVREQALDGLLALLHAHDVPAERVRDAAAVCADPHMRARGAVRDLGDQLLLDFPVRIGDTRSAATLRQPHPAEDLAFVLDGIGAGDERRAELAASGALPDMRAEA
ncbi:MAG TPA: CoA transferase [Candidatus Dormibacteraeota bacterium]|jgi:crotonobetainyl-CoA:carnitine CoA-transferase CaiB-like acyl-CoA transferase|nr:CoA transferase [Candidatus Dormibacteraeota bacterium]